MQFVDNVHTFEYPSFHIVMADFSETASENDDYDDEDEEDGVKIVPITENTIDESEDVNDDELERLARINAEFNTTNHKEKPLQPKGTCLPRRRHAICAVRSRDEPNRVSPDAINRPARVRIENSVRQFIRFSL